MTKELRPSPCSRGCAAQHRQGLRVAAAQSFTKSPGLCLRLCASLASHLQAIDRSANLVSESRALIHRQKERFASASLGKISWRSACQLMPIENFRECLSNELPNVHVGASFVTLAAFFNEGACAP